MRVAGPVAANSPTVLAPPARCTRKDGQPVSLLCSRNAAHRTNRICTLRGVLVHARTFEAKRATLEEEAQVRERGT